MIVAPNIQRSSSTGASYHLYGLYSFKHLSKSLFLFLLLRPSQGLREQGKGAFISGDQGNKCQLLSGIGEQRQY